MEKLFYNMSEDCDCGYSAKWLEYHSGLITAEEFDSWYNAHCAQCKYMHEVCMYGEI